MKLDNYSIDNFKLDGPAIPNIIPMTYDANHVAVYKFDENVGNGVVDYNGDNSGKATNTTIVTGYSGNARRFAGNGKIDFSAKVIPYNNAKTIKFRFRRNGLPAGTEWIMGNTNAVASGNNGDVVRMDTDGKIYYLVGQTASFIVNLKSSTAICDNNWHDVKITWDNTTSANAVKIYIDGVLNVQGTATSAQTGTPVNYLRIGVSNEVTPANYFTGDLDEIEISNIVR